MTSALGTSVDMLGVQTHSIRNVLDCFDPRDEQVGDGELPPFAAAILSKVADGASDRSCESADAVVLRGQSVGDARSGDGVVAGDVDEDLWEGG